MGRTRSLWLFLGLVLFAVSSYDVVNADVIPSENECRPYIEKAIHELKNTEPTATENEESTEENNITGEDTSIETNVQTADEDDKNESTEEATQGENQPSQEDEADSNVSENQEDNDDEKNDEGKETADGDDDDDNDDDKNESAEGKEQDEASQETEVDGSTSENQEVSVEDQNDETTEGAENEQEEEGDDTKEEAAEGEDQSQEGEAQEQTEVSAEEEQNDAETAEAENVDSEKKDDSNEDEDQNQVSQEADAQANDDNNETQEESAEEQNENGDAVDDNNDSNEADGNQEEANDTQEEANDTQEETADEDSQTENNAESVEAQGENVSEDNDQSKEETDAAEEENKKESQEQENASQEEDNENSREANADENDTTEDVAENEEESVEEEKVRSKRSISEEAAPEDNDSTQDETANDSGEAEQKSQEEGENDDDNNDDGEEEGGDNDDEEDDDEEKSEESMPEEDLTMEFEIPKNLRPRDHISDLLGLDAKSSIKENALKRTGDVILKELKRTYDNAIKPLEQLYKYRDLSNRHYGDPEIFSKPLVLFMGPWSGGKSTILNYLTDNEYTANSIRSGAEPSPAYFNILMHGDEPEVLDGTQLAADWTFSGLQKFGQGLMDRLRGQKLPSKLLERVNIVEIPGILEVRKQVSRYFPFNDACQWFIDRADIIFLVYDPSKLDVGPETEAILDQLKGREYQTRILLNKGDQVKPEELLRVQSALIWNISPLMSSAQPPVMYTVSLWSHPFEQGAPVRLLQAQERALLADLREAIDKRIENKIASARRFAVRIRNHAKMVDCYLTTYYNQKSLFSNKKQVSDKIIEHPQNYNIYEGLSTLTNISRYDLPDPEVYLDFFRLNPLYEFKKLSETCTYFKGCPIHKLDIAIAYDLPELVGKYKKLMEENYSQLLKEFDENCNQSEPEPPVKLR